MRIRSLVYKDQTGRYVYIGSAWPYPNGELHLGHVAALVTADVLARYHRRCGDHVLWTSGSDCHGTPITERARLEGRTPLEVATQYHESFVRTFERLGFSYSLYWATEEPEHYERVQASFLKLYQQGYIIEGEYQHARCDACQEKRVDREIRGVCPHCQKGARGDQCDHCGNLLDPGDLIRPTCAKCDQVISFDVTRELFLNLPAFEEPLREWVSRQTHWRLNAQATTQAWLKKGLNPRAITRDLDWGIPVPIPGWEDRKIYVWFEAVHGYWTASQQWALQQGSPDAWKPFWESSDPNVIAYYAIGKDNIPFHTLIWPAILMAQNLALPHHIVSSEYLGLEGRKLSTSEGWVLWAHDVLDRYDPDLIRYFLIASGPEKQDTDFNWERFIRVVNGEVIDNYGNLVKRVLGFATKHMENRVPEMHALDSVDTELLAQAESAFAQVGALIEKTEFRRAIELVMELVKATNQYFAQRAPWTEIKTDVSRADTTVAVAMQVIAALSILTEPFMPFQTERVQNMLPLAKSPTWFMPSVTPGTQLGEVQVLFAKLDHGLIQQERDRLADQLQGK